jgi:hypothetical protein
MGAVPQIGYPIVCSVSVFMIYLGGNWVAIDVQPNNTVLKKLAPFNLHRSEYVAFVALSYYVSGSLPRHAFASSRRPIQMSTFWVVSENFSHKLLS